MPIVIECIIILLISGLTKQYPTPIIAHILIHTRHRSFKDVSATTEHTTWRLWHFELNQNLFFYVYIHTFFKRWDMKCFFLYILMPFIY